MAAITGFGGVFLRADDPEALSAWYERHLGLTGANGAFDWAAPAPPARVVFALFRRDDAYFPTAQPAMLNLRVDDLDAVLDRLERDGVAVDPKRERYEFGAFGWCFDPEGHRIELWQPADAE